MGLLTTLLRSLDDLIAQGYPREVAERIMSGELPMDTESRMARAREQGFVNRQFHGTNTDISEFKPSVDGMQGPGIYSTSSPELAAHYANQRSKDGGAANVMPLLIRGDATDLSAVANMFPNTRIQDMASIQEPLRAEGITGLQRGNERVTFSPNDIRSKFAAFDPLYKGPNILGSAAGTAGLIGLLSPGDAEAGFVDRAGRTILEGFHGSPHKFDRFDISKIGTGEGAQAYGHGLYFADDKSLAEAYRDTLKMQHDPREGINKIVNDLSLVEQGRSRVRNTKTGVTYTADPNNPVHSKILSGEIGSADYEILPGSDNLFDSVVSAMKEDPRVAEFADNKDIVSDVVSVIRGHEVGGTVSDEALSSYRRLEKNLPEPSGALYRAEIDVAPDEMLDWDRPLSEQSEFVRSALKDLNPVTRGYYQYPGEERSGKEFYYGLRAPLTKSEAVDAGISVEDWRLDNNELASKLLRDKGIKGIRYLDGNSRGAGDGTSNYVIFDDGLINIAERGFADPRLLAGTAGGGLLATAIAPEVKASLEEAGVIGGSNPLRKPLGERAMGLVDRILTGLEVPQRGVQGLAATGYGLLSGEDFDTAVSRGADVVSQGVEASAKQFGDYVFDLTGSPEAATAAYTSGILGSPL